MADGGPDYSLAASLLAPTFIRQLLAPDIRTVLIYGCGGGFDFVHTMLLYPELRRLGKRVIIVSNSFADPKRFSGAGVRTVFADPEVRLIDAHVDNPPADYAPEVHLLSFLDQEFEASAPHTLYASDARSWGQPSATAFYQQLVDEHSVDAAVCIDGGSDSLMRGDERGLGDPLEDAVSVSALAGLQGLRTRLLLSVGFGCDRFLDVSDASSLRGVAELTRSGAYRGAIAIEPGSVGLDFYKRCLEHIYARQKFQSVLSGAIVSSALGYYGSDEVPPTLPLRAGGKCFLWPLMAMIWAFDPKGVVDRSLICKWIDGRPNAEMEKEFDARRKEMRQTGARRDVEELPKHVDA